MCPCGLIYCNKYATLVGNVEKGGGAVCVRAAEDYGKSLYCLLTFAVNLKLLYEIKSIFFKRLQIGD